MSHIAKVGRNSGKVRAGLAALYLILTLGALTTLYPFLLMVSTAMKGQSDFADYSPRTLIPPYLRDYGPLYARYVEDRYAGNLDAINAAHDADYASPAKVTPPADPESSGAKALAADWDKFTATLPGDTYTSAGFGEHDAAPSRLLNRYREHLREVFHGDIDALNQQWTEENVNFDGVAPPFEKTTMREWTPDLGPKGKDWAAFKAALPANFRVVTTADPIYRTYLKENIYEDSLDKLNAAWGTKYTNWNQIYLPRTLPAGKDRADWEAFLRTKFPIRMIGRDTAKVQPVWQAFLAKRNRPAETGALSDFVSLSGQARTDWMDFIAHDIPITAITADSPENLWRDSLAKEYGTVQKANTAFGTHWNAWTDAQPPQALSDWYFIQAHAGELRSEFATRNFRYVFDYIALHESRDEHAAWNTVIYCSLAVLGALIVNPLCAFALSRFPLPYAYKVLLFLLATMAFPAEVAMIPNFLLLRDMHLLNTFWALILPDLASGFSIFLLKGFFDSLPKELYEAGILDGASELTMFRRITMPLSLPIFSVIALNAFTAAYGAFLFALVVCQDQSRWTLMVWLYNLQSTAPEYVIMAALTLAALPTLIVFLLAQKVILRGIILPSFK